MAKEINLLKGDTLLQEGQVSTTMFFLVEGSVEITKKGPSGPVILGHAHSGEIIGEISFLDEMPRTATVTAASDCKFIEIPRDKFMAILAKQPSWIRTLIDTLARRLRKADCLIKV